jgi:hypothetical protein
MKHHPSSEFSLTTLSTVSSRCVRAVQPFKCCAAGILLYSAFTQHSPTRTHTYRDTGTDTYTNALTQTHTYTYMRAHMQAYTPLPISGGIVLSHGLPGAAVASVHADVQTHTHTHTRARVHTCKHTHPSPPQAASGSATACPGQQWQVFMLIC